MIGVQNQYLLSFSLEDNENFLQESDLIDFTLQEMCGNKMPIFEFSFNLRDVKILDYINQGNILKVSMGKNARELIDIPLLILDRNPMRFGDGQVAVKLKGIYNKPKYLKNAKIYCSEKKSAIEVIKEKVGEYFYPEFNIGSSDDKQYWIQPNISDRRFVSTMWLHAYRPDTGFAVGITATGKFVLKDIRRNVNKVRYRFYPHAEQLQSNYDFVYEGKYAVTDNSSLYANWTGYNRSKHFNTIEDGEDSLIEASPSPILSLSKFNRQAGVQGRVDRFGIQNENVHENYWKAYQQNLAYLGLMSSTMVQFSIWHTYIDLQILDRIYFLDLDESGRANPSSSGNYYVTSVVRQISDKMYRTNITCHKESFNSQKGDLE